MADFYDNYVAWMYWNPASGVFFGSLLLVLIGMTFWDIARPSVARRGFLPIPTTRGDRLFLSIMFGIGAHLVWLALWGTGGIAVASVVAIAAFGVIGRWG